jgi:hypothetical protein
MLRYDARSWRSRFIFDLNMQFFSKMSYFLFRLYSNMNRRLLMKLGDAERIVRCVSLFFMGDFLDFSLLYTLLFHLFCPQMAMRIKFGAQIMNQI